MAKSTPIAMIFGGARMGSVVGAALAARGYEIVFGWRSSQKPAEAAATEITRGGGQADTIQADLADASQLNQMAKTFEQKFGRLDVLINLASTYSPDPSPNASPEKAWDFHVTPNAKGSYLLSQALAPLLKKSGRGRIVHISDWTSASGRPRYKDFSTYYVSKLAVKGVVEALALELAPEVLVNGIAPGPILPPPDMKADEVADVARATPLKKWGGPEAIAKAVVFLVDTDFVTGETIRVDGGRHLS